MLASMIDPGWRGRALWFRIADVVGQILIAVVGAYAVSVAAVELFTSVAMFFAHEAHSTGHDHFGLYTATVGIVSIAATIVAVIPNIIWSCWQRRLSLRRALLSPVFIGLAAFALIAFSFFSTRNLPVIVALHAPGVVVGCLIVAITMYGWHRLWMHFARRYARP